jgi:hypothetical protein
MKFEQWWSTGTRSPNNPYKADSPAFWAWEGWQAGVGIEREECAQVCDKRAIEDSWEGCYADQCAADIRARGNP